MARVLGFGSAKQGAHHWWVERVTAIALVPSAGAALVTSGPFAWDGAISFWLRIVIYSVFLVILIVVAWAAVKRQAAEEQATASVAAEPVGAAQ